MKKWVKVCLPFAAAALIVGACGQSEEEEVYEQKEQVVEEKQDVVEKLEEVEKEIEDVKKEQEKLKQQVEQAEDVKMEDSGQSENVGPAETDPTPSDETGN